MKKLCHKLRRWLDLSLIIGLITIVVPDGLCRSLLVTFKEGQVYRMDPTSRQQAPIFRPYYEWYYERSLSVSPNDTFFAFIERKRGEFYSQEAARQGRYDVLPKLYLRIIDYKGELIQTIEDAQRYVWSPDGNKVAFITYDLKDADYSFRCPTGVWICNIETGEKNKIAQKAQKITWVQFNNCVYFYDWERVVYKWDSKTDKIDTTDYKDTHFSPDGIYYYYLPHPEVGGSIELYEKNTNKNISYVLPQDLGSLYGWVFNQGHFLLFIKKEVITRTEGTGVVKRIVSQEIRNVQNFIFDVEKKKVIKQFDGQISSWIGNGNKIVVDRERKIAFEEIPEEE